MGVLQGERIDQRIQREGVGMKPEAGKLYTYEEMCALLDEEEEE